MKRDELEQCLRGWKVRLRDSAHDVEEIQRRFYASKGAAAVRSLVRTALPPITRPAGGRRLPCSSP